MHTISCFSAVLLSYSCSGDIPRSLSLCSSISSSCCFSASLASRSLSLASHSLCNPAFSSYTSTNHWWLVTGRQVKQYTVTSVQRRTRSENQSMNDNFSFLYTTWNMPWQTMTANSCNFIHTREELIITLLQASLYLIPDYINSNIMHSTSSDPT